jgi:amidase
MKRRSFLKTGSFAGVLLGSSPFSRTFGSPAANRSDEFPLAEMTISDLQARMERGELTSQGITRLYLDRIAAVDQAGPRLNSVIEVNPDALAIAGKLDQERSEGFVRGPLHGIPVLIKDNIDSADAMHTTAGSLAIAEHMARKDAFIVARLRNAGAVLLGKTNLSEWANMRSSKSSSGWSSRGGQTRNPYFLDRNPSGSSSGSGAAVAANLCVVAVGTETDGSITSPASSNCIVGIKPTVGLLSRSGIIPISSTQDTPGPMARSVADAAVLLSGMIGVDDEDPVTRESKGKAYGDYRQFLDPKGLEGKRIGIEKKPQSENRYINALFEEAVSLMKLQGAEIVRTEYVDAINGMGEAEFTVLQYEFRETLNRYLDTTQGTVRSLADVIRFNADKQDKAMPYFGQDVLESSDAKKGLESREYLDALSKSRDGSREILDHILVSGRLDALCGITAGPPCSIDVIYGDRWGDVSSTTPAAVSGYPHISVPCGMVHGLPVGLSFFGRSYSEPLLISIAFAYEQASRKRVPPGFVERYEGR